MNRSARSISTTPLGPLLPALALAFACSAAANKTAAPGSGGSTSGSAGLGASSGTFGAAGASGGASGTSSGGNDTTGGNAGASASAGAAGAAAGAGAAGNGGGAGSAGVGDAGAAGAAGNAGNAGTSGGSAGTSGAAGSAGANGSPCSAPGLLFCDDFEARPLGSTFSAPWSTTFIGGSSTIAIDDSVPAHSGTRSVRTHPTDDSYQTLLVYHDAAVLPVASGRFYMRAQVRFGTAMTGGHNTFLMANLFATPDQGMVTRVGEDYQMLMMTVGGDAHGYLSNEMFWQNMQIGVQFQASKWECLEMMFDSPNTSFDVWFNDTEVPDLHVTNLAHENYDSLRFGFEKYAGPVSDIWWDDIAIGTQKIGCN